VGPRLGRNARFSSVGTGLAAGVMGVVGSLITPQAVFFVTAALAVPTFLVLTLIREEEIDPIRADGGFNGNLTGYKPSSVATLLGKPSLLILTLCVFLFHAANAAMLPLVGAEMTVRSGYWATALVAACIVLPQLVVALIAPGIGQLAVSKGRRPILILGFAVLPIRAAVLALNSDPAVIIGVQMLDGLSAAVLGVLVPLSLADISRGTGRFNLAQGIVGSATGIGAAASTAVAGHLATQFGVSVAFAGLAFTAVCAFLAVLVAMPETTPDAAYRGAGEPK
jgi:MFS family permease